MKTAIKRSTIMCCYSWLLKNTAMHVEGLVTARNVTQWLKSCHPVWQKIDKSIFQMYPILILIMTGSGFEIEFRLPNENINFHSLYAVKNFLKHSSTKSFNPNWQEAVHFSPPCPFWIRFCQLIFQQKFPNFFGG